MKRRVSSKTSLNFTKVHLHTAKVTFVGHIYINHFLLDLPRLPVASNVRFSCKSIIFLDKHIFVSNKTDQLNIDNYHIFSRNTPIKIKRPSFVRNSQVLHPRYLLTCRAKGEITSSTNQRKLAKKHGKKHGLSGINLFKSVLQIKHKFGLKNSFWALVTLKRETFCIKSVQVIYRKTVIIVRR